MKKENGGYPLPVWIEGMSRIWFFKKNRKNIVRFVLVGDVAVSSMPKEMQSNRRVTVEIGFDAFARC